MDDIAPELLAKVEKKFQDLRLRDRDLLALIQRCVQPGATQADVAAYAERLGELLGAALTEEVGPDVMPGGRLHLNIAKKLVDPLLRDAHLMVNRQAADVQRQIDKADKVGMKPAEAEYPARRLQDLYWTACDPANDDPLGMIARQAPTAVRRFHDDFIQTNAEKRYQAGMRPTIERECEAKACTWCRDRAGSWDYESVRRGGEVFQRHENCRCTVTFINGKERQDVWTKKRWQADEETEAARIAVSEAAGLHIPSDEVKAQRRAVGAKLPENDAEKRAERITYSQEKAAALKEKREKGVANPAGSGSADGREEHISVNSKLGKDVTAEYKKNARPGVGSVTEEEGYDRNNHFPEIETANLLIKLFGGDISLRKESIDCSEMRSDYLWNGRYWEEKGPTTAKAANSAVRKGLQQIAKNPGGIILNYRKNDIPLQEIVDVIDKRMQWKHSTDAVDIMIILEEKPTVLRYE